MNEMDHIVCEEKATKDSDRFTRRGFLATGAAGILGTMLNLRFQKRAGWCDSEVRELKRCILLWMDGGPSQLDTFDPKPGTRNGGTFRSIATSVPELRICEHLPRTAEQMRHLTVIRSVVSKEGSHERARYLGHTGFSPNPTVVHPSIGAVIAKELGTPKADLPQYVSISSPSFGAGYLGPDYGPFFVSNPLERVENAALPEEVSEHRFRRRLSLLDRLERRFALSHPKKEVRSHHSNYRHAVRFMFAPEQRAFDLEEEPATVRSAYGATPFGHGCLLARRLIETGVPFVEVTLKGWDTHQDNFTRTQTLCEELDPAFAALVCDLRERDLWEKTLVIWMGEFGRTPEINPQEGRDHSTQGWSVVLGGCGLPEGLCVGRTSPDGKQVVETPVTIPDLFYTFLTVLGIDPASEYRTSLKRPVTYVDQEGKPIPGLVVEA